MNQETDGWTKRQMDGQRDRGMDQETDGWTKRQMDGSRDRWTKEEQYIAN